jgi:hypothetical protein
MISRGFQGHFRLLSEPRLGLGDAVFLGLASGAPLLARVIV